MTKLKTIGIDFSISSPAVAIDHGDSIEFLVFPREGSIKATMLETLCKSNISITMLQTTPQLPAKSTIAQTERRALSDAQMQITEIINALSKKTENYALHVGIEGLSFASTSSRLSQISGYQWLLRYKLLSIGMSLDNMYIFAPNNIKLTAGKGNYKKEDMIAAFINSKDLLLEKNELWLALQNNPALFQNRNGKWDKPLDDIVDAYWILQTIKKI